MADIIPPATIGQLLASVPPLAVTLGFLYIWSRRQQSVTDRQNQLIDLWWERHEKAEEKQFATIEKLGECIDRSAEKITANTAVLNDVHKLLSRQNSDFSILSHEPQMNETLRIGLPEYHPGERLPYDEILRAEHLNGALSDQRPWSHQPLGIPALYAEGIRGAGAVVAVIDTGVQPDHQDLAANLDMGRSRDFTGSGVTDRNGHGTHCAGIVACDDQGVGIMGVAPDARVVTVKSLSDGGSGTASGLAAGIMHAANDPVVDVFSMSFGADAEIPQITSAINFAASRGKILVAAAGNSGPGSINWPGALPNVICVGAVNETLRVDTYSSANDNVDVAAPGTRILSTIPGGRYGSLTGTSMACPFVAGVIALAVGEAKKRGLKPVTDIKTLLEILEKTCRDIGTPGKDPGAGFGLIQPRAFITEYVARCQSGVTPSPVPVPQPPAEKIVRLNVPKDATQVIISLV